MRHPMDLTAPDTLNVGLYDGPNGCSVVATVRRVDHVDEVLAATDTDAWRLLAKALLVLEGTGMQTAIFTNHAAIADALQHPRRPPAPTKWVQDRKFGKVGYGGNEHHWSCLRSLSLYCRTFSGGGFKVFLVDSSKLRRAGEVYAQRSIDTDISRIYTEQHASPTPAGTTCSDGGVQPSLFAAGDTTERWQRIASLLGGENRTSVRHAGSGDVATEAGAVPIGDRKARDAGAGSVRRGRKDKGDLYCYVP